VYFDSIPVITGDPNNIGKQKSIISNSGIAADASNKSFGFEMGSNRRQKSISKEIKDAK
jgi:hypothetical protein